MEGYAYDGTDNYNLDVEPWEPNITTLVNFDSKWKDMLGIALRKKGIHLGSEIEKVVIKL